MGCARSDKGQTSGPGLEVRKPVAQAVSASDSESSADRTDRRRGRSETMQQAAEGREDDTIVDVVG